MAKLPQKTYPTGHTKFDFSCFGPAATKDGEFSGTMIVDMGCFEQTGKDSNKYYHTAVVQSKKDQGWYLYSEWARTDAANPAFIFDAYDTKEEAIKAYIKLAMSKNVGRGKWENHSSLGKILIPRVKKDGSLEDMYSVRPQATRSTGLPDAKTIVQNEGAKITVKSTTITVRKAVTVDAPTLELMRALNVGTINYTRSAMTGSALPTQAAIEEGRTLLTEAQKRLQTVGDNLQDQTNDPNLMSITRMMYSRIPKKKHRSDGPEKWVLNGNNIAAWSLDLDAFESALYANSDSQHVSDPFDGMPLQMRHLTIKDNDGKFIHDWFPRMTRNRHRNMSDFKVKHIWKIDRSDNVNAFRKAQEEIAKNKCQPSERPLHQPSQRPDISETDRSLYHASHTCLTIHGTRSVNVSGLLRTSWRLPKTLVGVRINAWQFGPGIYLADDFKKSAQYCSVSSSRWVGTDGEIPGRGGFLFLADAVLGNPYFAEEGHPYTKVPDGHHSVCGIRERTSSKYGNGWLENNEWIVYSENQCLQRYLIEFEA